MEHLKMQTADMADRNIEQIGALFPECLTERINSNGRVEQAIDFDKLRQLLAHDVVEGPEQRYQFTWPDKRAAIRLANTPTSKTLRPCRAESVDFDTTQNLYIEGDNLDVLKLLRENYLGKVKMIYIDPPYNTGNDFVYNDDFAKGKTEFEQRSGLFDAEGHQTIDPMQRNTEANGRFHTDWLNMIYPRLKVARDLLSDDGVIFISIDENEIENLKKICNEVFGQDKFANSFIVRRYDKNLNRQFMNQGLKSFNIGFEYILCYSKNTFLFNPIFKASSEERASTGYWKGFWNDANRPTMRYNILGYTPTTGQWKWSKELAYEAVKNYEEYVQKYSHTMTLEEYWEKTGRCKKFIRRNPNGKGKNAGVENWISPADGILRNTNWTDILASRNDDTTQGLFDFPKNVDLLKLLLEAGTNSDSLVLDFFSGSATTAHAVMQLNAEDGGNRKFIMVQLPEKTDPQSEAYKAGYPNICEIGKERIRRAGKKIKEENKDKEAIDRLDTGFRVLKLDSSNMADVYYTPAQTPIEQTLGFEAFEDNIKPDRTAEDLLFQVMPECNLPLSSRIEEREIHGKKVYAVDGNYLVACFDRDIDEQVITEIARMQPYYFVMRDASAATDNVLDNFDQIFNAYSKETIRRIL
uniref:site-specific DNA-methyltransferase n=1 Tax=Alistipes megaguti TaxID=2364787 RepID=UPI000EFA3AE9|nr:site-specific DNA-methyltransferase [Alistipes megaguti]